MKRKALPLALIMILCGRIYAHHSISGVYDTSRQVSIEGVVTEFRFVNPHPYVVIVVKASDGNTRPWKIEMDNRAELVQAGMSAETLRAGDHVVVTGSPIRPPQSQALYIRKLDRPSDGFEYEQVGSSPRIRFRSR